MPRFHVHRSLQIHASPEKVFETVADFGTWTTWSPWLCAEPDAEVVVTPDAASVGSVYSWNGELVGQGELEHRRLQPRRLIEQELRFVKPFRSTSQVSFEMVPVGEGTEITWQMRGSLPWFLFFMRSRMEVFIGMDYERGLRMLKEWIETGTILSTTTIRGVESVGPLSMAGVRKQCSIHEIGPSMDTAFAEADQAFSASQLPTGGRRISVYHDFDVRAQTFDYTSGFVLPETAGPVPSGLSSWSLPETEALCVEHLGRYEHLGNAWSAANQFARYKKLKQSKGEGYELYKNCPEETDPAALLTEVVLPLKSSAPRR